MVSWAERDKHTASTGTHPCSEQDRHPHLPNLFAMTPTLKEPTMPPTLKMETAMLQTTVQTPGLIGCL